MKKFALKNEIDCEIERISKSDDIKYKMETLGKFSLENDFHLGLNYC